VSARPERKRRKVSYANADGGVEEGDKPWTNEDRLALANRDVNKYPVFKPKDKEAAFKQRFSVPLINKDAGGYNAGRVAPALGMRRSCNFIAKPLHDPSGEFSIVLYDPTIDERPEDEPGEEKDKESDQKPKLDVPLMHKSLADILGLKKQVNDKPKVPVVIDPRLAKVLRPHQVEGVKVKTWRPMFATLDANSRIVSLPLHDWNDPEERKWMYNGRRDGIRKDG
jgi:DNA repair and recombination protein RAD54 and RAD54-like protein